MAGKTEKRAEQTAKSNRGRKITIVGEVISDKMDKTIRVQVYWMVRHSRYGKYVRRRSVFRAHDENNVAKAGDLVRIMETRPLSKTKRWRLMEVVEARQAVQGVDL